MPTPSIPLTSVLSLPNFSFNLMSVSKLTRALKCYISFFPDFCLFQDLMTKRIIGRGRESGGLYILDPTIQRPIACSGVTTPFETYCRLGHLSLPLLKKLCPQFSSLLSLDCESCQFSKHHRLSYSPRVNKRVSAPFELVHSDVWGLCPVVSPTGFQYFVTFVDDYSRTTWLYLMKNHSELFSHFRAFCAEIHTQFHVYVQNLRVIMQKNMFPNNFSPSCFNMASFIRLLMLTLLLRMELVRERIDTSLKLLELYYFKCMCPSISGLMLFPQLVF